MKAAVVRQRTILDEESWAFVQETAVKHRGRGSRSEFEGPDHVLRHGNVARRMAGSRWVYAHDRRHWVAKANLKHA